jgi:hypothetical protein
MMMMARTLPSLIVLGRQTIGSSSNINLVKTLAPHDYENNDNDDDDKDDLVRFANNASLSLSCLCKRIDGLMNMAAVAAAADNANSLVKDKKQSTIKKQKKWRQRGRQKCGSGCRRMTTTWQRQQECQHGNSKGNGCGCSSCSGGQGNGGGQWLR